MWNIFQMHIILVITQAVHCFCSGLTGRMLDMGESNSSVAGKRSPAAAAARVSSTFTSHTFTNVTLSLHKGSLHDFKVWYL